MRRRSRKRTARLFLAGLLAITACTTPRPAPAPLPSAAEAPVPVPAMRVALPETPARSGVLYRLGLKSDLTDLSIGTAGTLWIVTSGDRAELLQGPVVFRPASPAGGASETAFQVQAGAFSQEDPARKAADRLASEMGVVSQVAFAPDRGLYRVLLGNFSTRAEADAFLEKLKGRGQDGFVVAGAARPPEPAAGAAPSAAGATITVTGTGGAPLTLASPVDLYGPAPEVRVAVDGVPYRGSLRVLVNPRGTLNVVNRVDLEDYLYGVVPAEMGPKRFDAIEALKAQAVAARTYALAHRGQFEAEGYDICPGPKCQAYGGASVEDPLSTAAVDGTRGLVLAHDGQFADALYVSTCGGVTENVENVFSGGPVPYLVSVECGELPGEEVSGSPVPRDASGPRTSLEWRGYVLRRLAPKKAAVRAASLEAAQKLAGVRKREAPPTRLTPSAVYPSLVSAFELTEARAIQLTARDEAYFDEPPSAGRGLTGAPRGAYEFLLRFRFAGDALPPADRELTEEEYGGLAFSVALRTMGVTEGSGRFLAREGSNLWVKAPEGRIGLPVDPEVPFARRIGEAFFPAPRLRLRPGDRVRWFKNGGRLLAFWVELDPDGPTYERESAWTEWVRRVGARELARRMSGRVAGNEVREIAVTQRSATGRAIEMRVQTDLAEATFRRFDVRQAVEMPEMLFSVTRVDGPGEEKDFVFLGRGWGHGVGMCQNGAFGMALAGQTYEQILRHYYTGIDIVVASTVSAAPVPSTR
ncbi:MAG: SpoIID/LytB domain-containing protein [Thermoanaerobaculia bacterium]